MNKNAFDVTVIVVNWNGASVIPACLDSVRCASKAMSIQTILVDNGSKDGSAEIVRNRYPWVQLIEAGVNLGFGRANNIAVQYARGKYTFILNPDATVEHDTLEKACVFFNENPEVACIGCLVVDELGTIQQLGVQRDPTPILEFLKLFIGGKAQKAYFKRLLPYKDPCTSGPVFKLYGSNMIIRTELFKEIGGFDERFFMYCEDVDLCRRIRERGQKLYYFTDTRVQHHQGSCTKGAPRGFSVLMQCDALEKYFKKYHGFWGPPAFRLLLFFGASIRLAIGVSCVAVARIQRKKDSVADWNKKVFRNWMMFRWSCFTKRAFIPS